MATGQLRAVVTSNSSRQSSVEEALIEMYLAGVSVRRVEDITQALWGTKVAAAGLPSLAAISHLGFGAIVRTFPYGP
jgi:transposase-like protein